MILEYIPLFSAMIFAGILVASLLQFSNLRKNMKIQSEQQIYARIIELRLKLEDSEIFTKMAKQSSVFAKRFSKVDNPEEYYISVAFLDLFEFIFRLRKTKMIDSILWERWLNLASLLFTIPKFKNVWNETKQSHTVEFRDFFDSLASSEEKNFF